MSDNPEGSAPASKPSFFSRRTLIVVLAVVAVVVVAWVVLKTEVHVADLRSRGFTDFAIDSARDHAYFPLIGGLLGGISFVMIGRLIRRLLGREKQS